MGSEQDGSEAVERPCPMIKIRDAGDGRPAINASAMEG